MSLALSLQRELSEIFGGNIPEHMMKEVQDLEFIIRVRQSDTAPKPPLKGQSNPPSKGFIEIQIPTSEWALAFVADDRPMAPNKYLCAWVPDANRFGPAGFPQGDSAPVVHSKPLQTWQHQWGAASPKLCGPGPVRARGCLNRERDISLYSVAFRVDAPKKPLAYFTLDTALMSWRRTSVPARSKQEQKQLQRRTIDLSVGDRIVGMGRVISLSPEGQVTLRRKSGAERTVRLRALVRTIESKSLRLLKKNQKNLPQGKPARRRGR